MNNDVIDLDFGEDIFDDSPDSHEEDYTNNPLDIELEEEEREDLEDSIFDDSEPKEEEINSDDSLINSILKSKGILDPLKLKYEDELGQIQEINFNDLSLEEKINIISGQDNTNNLDDQETAFFNFVRENNVSIQDYIEYEKQQAIQEYLQNNTQQKYQVSDLNDEELYVLNLQDMIPNLSEDDARIALQSAKDNPLWEKQIAALRTSYEEKEKALLEEENQAKVLEQENQRQQFESTILSTLDKLDKINVFTIEKKDKEEMADFILNTDATGTNHLYKALNDPETLAKVTWFLKKGEDAFNELSNYYLDKIKEYSKANYEKGLADGSKKGNKTTIIKKTSKTEDDDQFIPLNKNTFVFNDL